MPSDRDPELAAMRIILAALRPLSRDAVRRVLWWINEVLAAERTEKKEKPHAQTP